eukprot:m.39933 g.39933  ORF g.39933 m.39933 type:complete len:105 (+) comp11669_c0_seq2:171-485(+)
MLSEAERQWLVVAPLTTALLYAILIFAAKPLQCCLPLPQDERQRWKLAERMGSLSHAIFASIIGYLITHDPTCTSDLIHGTARLVIPFDHLFLLAFTLFYFPLN